jgi:hypothetical protein
VEHHASVVFHGDVERTLDFVAGALTAQGFKIEGRTHDELRASFATKIPAGGELLTLVLLRGKPGDLSLDVRVTGLDELQRRTTRFVLWVALALFALQGTAFTLVFRPPARLYSIGMAAALVVFFVVLWLVFGPRIFRSFERRIRRALEKLLGEAAAAGEK